MGSSSSDSESQSPHVAFFPFMAKGHTIPLLHLIRLLRRRFHHLSVTVFTTAANRHFISQFLSDASVSVVNLSFPQNVPGLPAGVEGTEALPSLSLLPEFCMATKLMQHEFEKHLQSLNPPITFLVSDSFFVWTLESTSKFGIPHISFSGMSNFVVVITEAVMKDNLLAGAESDDELITVTRFPWVKVSRKDWDPVFWPESDPTSLHSQFIRASIEATISSYGTIVNSFYELEPPFCNYLTNRNETKFPKSWNIGPLCLGQLESDPKAKEKAKWVEWLDRKQSRGEAVLYVSFGSQAEISADQLKEIAKGLEESGANFLWAKKGREREGELEEGFEERVKGRGIVVREWVEQWGVVLGHGSVEGFFSHCGWNSVVESLSCGVPILGWPIMAEQGLNARAVVEDMGAGLAAGKGFLEGERLGGLVRELMEGESGRRVRKRAVEISEMAKRAMAEGGSSSTNLERLIHEMCSTKLQNNR